MCESFYAVVTIQILNRANLFFHMFHVKHMDYYSAEQFWSLNVSRET